VPAIAATTAPLVRVLRSEEEMPVIARLVVVACEVVAKFAVKSCKVVEPVVRMFVAVSPPLKAIWVVVALFGNGYANVGRPSDEVAVRV
jgi:hypothetical protein